MHQHCPLPPCKPASLVRAGQKGSPSVNHTGHSGTRGVLWNQVPQFLKGKETMGTKKVPGRTRELCGTLGLLERGV